MAGYTVKRSRMRRAPRIATGPGYSNYLRTAYNVGRGAYKAYKYGKTLYKGYKRLRGPSKVSPRPTKRFKTYHQKKTIMARRGMSLSKCNLKYKSINLKLYRSIANRATKSTNGYFTVLGPMGEQTPQSLGIWNTGSFINGVFEDARQLGNDINNASSQKLYIESFTNTLEFNNAGPVDHEMIIYDVIAKVTQQTTRNPVDDWRLGLLEQQKVGTTILHGEKVPFAKPTDCKFFNMNWRIVGRETVYMSPGTSHKHIFTHKINRPFDTEYADQYSTIRGITMSSFVVVKGTPIDSVADYAAGDVTLSPCKVIGTWTASWVSRLLVQNQRLTVTNNTLPKGVTNLYQQDEESGAVEQVKALGSYLNFA